MHPRDSTDLPDSKRSNLSIFLVSLTISATVFFLIPGHVFFHNKLDFSNFRFTEAIAFLLLITCVSTIAISLILKFLPLRIYPYAFSIFFALGLLLWLQGAFFAWEYGRLDGRPIDWDNFNVYGYAELAVWAICLILCIVKRASLKDWTPPLAVIVIGSQLFTLGYLAYAHPTHSYKKYSFHDNTKFEFGSKQNVIILVVDTLQSDVFEEIIQSEPKYAAAFDSFTYFSNAISGFPTTYASISNILTGRQYNNSKPFHQFLKNAFLKSSRSIPKVLSKAGYRVEFYPLTPKLVFIDPASVHNIEPRKPNFFTTNLSMNFVVNIDLVDLSIFRVSPHFLKRFIFEDTLFKYPKAEDNMDIDFKLTATRLSTVTSREKVFKYFHLFGAHAPFTINEKLELEYMNDDRNGYIRQSKAALLIVSSFLEDLKRIGVFDDSMIFIVADHGFFYRSMGILGVDESNSPIPEKIRASALPLVLVKKPRDSGTLKNSDTPVTLGDVPATIIKTLNISTTDKPSFFDSLPKERERRFLYFDNGIDGLYLSPFDEYIVSGNSRDPRSWRDTKQRFSRGGVSTITN